MMPGHGANPIFFNKKSKDWTSRTLTTPHAPTSDNNSFLSYRNHYQAVHSRGLYKQQHYYMNP